MAKAKKKLKEVVITINGVLKIIYIIVYIY